MAIVQTAAVGVLAAGTALAAQTARPAVSLTAAETRTARAFDAAKKAGAPELYAFLKLMPKGADLHMHLSGAVYAETFIKDAVKQALCVVPVEPGTPAVPLAADALRLAQPVTGKGAPCGNGGIAAAEAYKDQQIYDDLIDSFSMRGFVPTPGITGHDQFFATFARYGALGKGFAGEWLDQVASRAAAQNEQYLEIMHTPTFTHAAALGSRIGWPFREAEAKAQTPPGSGGSDAASGSSSLDLNLELGALRDKLLAAGLRDEVPTDIQELNAAEQAREQMEHCSLGASLTPGAATAPPALLTSSAAAVPPVLRSASGGTPSAGAAPACGVRIHWLYQILRGYPPQQVFAQTLLGFEVASADPDVVGLNFVMPEDSRLAMQEYHLQMQMLAYLHTVYPKVHISLHAGELAFGMTPPEGLSFHIRDAIDLGHAERIGHGVDVLYEDRPAALLQEMAARHIMVEINLTSNAVILGVQGKQHPLAAYRAAHVPVALSTDDEGVSRIDLTHEYVRGAEEQDLDYIDLKQMARTSLEHAFLQGESLWTAEDVFTRPRPVCAAPIFAASIPSVGCAAFLKANERAREQWEMERRFAVFEAAH